MPGVSRWGVNKLIEYLKPIVDLGLKSVLLFSVTSKKKVITLIPANKSIYNKQYNALLLQDPLGTLGTDPSNPVLLAIKKLKENFPELLIACDVCLCPYTDHGHCGILKVGLYCYL